MKSSKIGLALSLLAFLMAFTTVFSPYATKANDLDLQFLPDGSLILTPEQKEFQEFVDKVDPYVEVNKSNKKFQLTKDAKENLDRATLKEAQKFLNERNKELKHQLDEFSISADGNALEATLESADEFAPMSSAHIRATNRWYGFDIWFSSSFVQAFSDNILLFGATVQGINTALLVTLAAFKISPPGWVTSAVTAIAFLGAWLFISRDQGCGVNLRVITISPIGAPIPTVWNAC
ncbi:DUF1104 domain-containing protein [Evansella tamaricis]|uniref:DUF1104 domain-containing protein n=1 Tax=Evansella tamaricis TaxID=2069301 RepID=A0ABS6JGH6_9BACI|nr:DUF1104 domain-containing protein [Evansella tamaricis]MBU9711560.1 DUF1104 domain-containing protein [Evansella tamaricis]